MGSRGSVAGVSVAFEFSDFFNFMYRFFFVLHNLSEIQYRDSMNNIAMSEKIQTIITLILPNNQTMNIDTKLCRKKIKLD